MGCPRLSLCSPTQKIQRSSRKMIPMAEVPLLFTQAFECPKVSSFPVKPPVMHFLLKRADICRASSFITVAIRFSFVAKKSRSRQRSMMPWRADRAVVAFSVCTRTPIFAPCLSGSRIAWRRAVADPARRAKCMVSCE